MTMMCPVCNDRGCFECDGRGQIEIVCCPMDYVTEDIIQLLEYAELFKKGLPPIAGGTLDQAKNFLSAARMVFNEQQIWKNKLGIF